MKKKTLFDWAKDFALGWIGPKSGTAAAVFPLAGIILSTAILVNHAGNGGAANVRGNSVASAGAVQNQAKVVPTSVSIHTDDAVVAAKAAEDRALDEMVSIVTRSTQKWQEFAYILAGVLWLLAILAQACVSWRKPRGKLGMATFFLAQWQGKLSALFGFVLGMLVVPLTLCWAVSFTLPGGLALLAALIPATLVYLFICGCIHWFGFFSGKLTDCIVYVVRFRSDLNFEDLGESYIKDLTKDLKGTSWTGAPEFLAQSDDGQASIIVPIRYSVMKWSNDEATALLKRLYDFELKWCKKGVTVFAKVLSPGFAGKGSADLKKVAIPESAAQPKAQATFVAKTTKR